MSSSSSASASSSQVDNEVDDGMIEEAAVDYGHPLRAVEEERPNWQFDIGDAGEESDPSQSIERSASESDDEDNNNSADLDDDEDDEDQDDGDEEEEELSISSRSFCDNIERAIGEGEATKVARPVRLTHEVRIQLRICGAAIQLCKML
jgi:hypothetical protein